MPETELPGGPLPPERHVPALVESLGKDATVLDGLTAKERRFVEEYPKDLNGRQACIRAGYSEKSAAGYAYELLRKQRIVDAMAAVMAKRSASTGIDRSWVLTNLVQAHDKAKGKDTAAFMAHRLKSLELIGRHVDVRAFRAGLGFGDGDDDERQIWDLSRLDDAEFDLFERLLAKVTVITPNAGGAGGTEPAAGPGTDRAGPGGDSGGL